MMSSTKFLTVLGVLAMIAMPTVADAQLKLPDGSNAPSRPAPAVRAPAQAKPAPAVRAPAQARPAPAFNRPAVRGPSPQAPRNVQRAQPQAPRQAVTPRIERARPVNREVRQQQRQLRQATPQAKTEAIPKSQLNTQAKTQLKTQTDMRQIQRTERAQIRREQRELRKLPAAQRAAKRDDFRKAREQRTLQRQQVGQPQLQQPQLQQPQLQLQNQDRAARQANRAARLSGVARVTPQAARQGRFASRLGNQQQLLVNGQRVNRHNFAARRAWRQGLRAGFVPWYGPVFWPYAYSDVFDYAFWPGGYDDGFWDYAYDDFIDGLFWGEVGPPADYAYAPSGPVSRPTQTAVQQLCQQPGSGITAWPFAEIEKKVGLNADQKALLGDVRKAGADAAAVFKASCPPTNAFPLTPPGRLQGMTARLDATLQAVRTVRPALETFYASLSDEQKERFNEIGPKKAATNAEASAAASDASSCKDPKAGLSNLPMEKIEDVVKPTDEQADGLKKLEDATTKAVSILQAACPDETPITPPGRLEAMEKRLTAMIEAANTVKPELESFYASLSAEQKAHFNRIGRDLASTEQ